MAKIVEIHTMTEIMKISNDRNFVVIEVPKKNFLMKGQRYAIGRTTRKINGRQDD